jgi:hypothetical protein
LKSPTARNRGARGVNGYASAINRMDLLDKGFENLIATYQQYAEAASLLRANKDKFGISEEETQSRSVSLIGGRSSMPVVSDFSDDKFKLLNLKQSSPTILPIRDIRQCTSMVFRPNTFHVLLCQFSNGAAIEKHAIACCCFQGAQSKQLYIFDPNRGEYVVMNTVDFWDEVINTGKAYGNQYQFFDMIILEIEKKLS